MNYNIITVCMVKNEEDIVESFLRYCCLFSARVIVLDNFSTDRTMTILQLLANEGLPVSILADQELGYFQAEKTSRLIQLAIEKYGADLILPLDADEFLVSASENESLLNILQSLSPEQLQYVRWRTYIPHSTDDMSDACVLRRIHYSRPVSSADMCKIIISASLWNLYELQITFGNHDVVSRNDPQAILPKTYVEELSLAHFPIRSLDQCKAKAFIGHVNNISRYDRFPADSSQSTKMFADLKKSRLQQNNFAAHAKGYLSSFQLREEYRPIKDKKLEEMQICYTELSRATWLQRGLENMELLAIETQNISRNIPPQQSGKVETEIQERLAERLAYLQTLQKSFSWRLTLPLRFFARMARFLKKIRSVDAQ